MTKSDTKDAALATVIIGAAAMFMGTMFASAAPAEDIPAPVHSIVTPADILGGEGGNMSFESEGGSLLGE